MRKYVIPDEIESLSEALIRLFIKRTNGRNVRCIDIETFATQFLGLKLVYEAFAEEDPGRIGFFADGVKPLLIARNGVKQDIVFEANTIVIEKRLLLPSESGRKRFTIAHEAAHMILQKHFPVNVQAAFHSDFDCMIPCTPEAMKEALNLNEIYSNRMAACLLMPRVLVESELKKHNGGKKIVVYEGFIISKEEKLKMRTMSEEMGVSFLALLNRLKELDLFEFRDAEEYAAEYLGIGGENVPKAI